jgi:tRNA (guanine37-N1)-methyltransferase
MKIKQYLSNIIPKELHSLIPNSYDLIGSKKGQVAIIEIPQELENYKIKIAEAIKNIHKNVKAVLRKKGPRLGEYRLYNYEILMPGETDVIHKEYGYYLRVDPLKMYFSTRDAKDRIDIANSVKAGEKIIYMFAGACPYAIAIAKKQPDVQIIVAIEKNEEAFNYMLYNKILNKVGNKILCINDDVLNVCPFFDNYADRVIMTLPLISKDYLKLGIGCLKDSGGILHYYKIVNTDYTFNEIEKIVENDLKGSRLNNFKIVSFSKVSNYSPGKAKYRIDLEIRKKF